MAVNNSLAPKGKNEPRLGITAYLNSEKVLGNIEQALGTVNKQRFITSVISAVNNNAALADCTNQSILSAALLGESLNLSPSPQLGHFYMVPFDDKKKGKVATFQMGYKGYIQLAIRSGQYKKINVLAIKEGELRYFDPLNEEIKVELMVDDWDAREKAPTIGYYAMFELCNGFRKAIYWSKNQMLSHADKYSPAFSRDGGTIRTKSGSVKKVSFADYEAGKFSPDDAWLYSSFWYKNFDGMAYKTMLRQLISKWGIMSTELQSAFDSDMTFTSTDGSKNYVESDDDVIDMEQTDDDTYSVVEEAPEQPTAAPQNASAALFGNN